MSNLPPPLPDERPLIAGRRVNGWKQVRPPAKPIIKQGATPGLPGAKDSGIASTRVSSRGPTPEFPDQRALIGGRRINGYRPAARLTTVEAAGPTVRTVEAGSGSMPGTLGGQHAGGHSDAGVSMGSEMPSTGKPLSAMEKLGSAGRIGARMATEEDLLP